MVRFPTTKVPKRRLTGTRAALSVIWVRVPYAEELGAPLLVHRWSSGIRTEGRIIAARLVIKSHSCLWLSRTIRSSKALQKRNRQPKGGWGCRLLQDC
jgi:hypothetical protein